MYLSVCFLFHIIAVTLLLQFILLQHRLFTVVIYKDDPRLTYDQFMKKRNSLHFKDTNASI